MKQQPHYIRQRDGEQLRFDVLGPAGLHRPD
jgi:hypothetical protein